MITPVLLCGGSGTRLWPLSRQSYPKQFAPLIDEVSLFQAAAQRFAAPGYSAPLIVTNSDFRFIVTEQLVEIGIDPGAVLIEPETKNTAPAILAAALWLEKTDPDRLMIVAPSDHVIPNHDLFRQAVSAGADAAKQGKIVTFGIPPAHPETGYGYLELSHRPSADLLSPLDLLRFVEKPNLTKAKAMVEAGTFLWNSGIFLFSVSTILAAFRDHAPSLDAPVRRAVKQAKPDLGFLRLDRDAWTSLEDISIDYAVMEQSNALCVVPYHGAWSDLGGWDAVQRETPRDRRGVGTLGPATAIDCENTLLRSEAEDLELVGIGLKDIITVAMPDAVLVAHAAHAQDVKKAVAQLKAKGAKQATQFPKDHRPWGWFESLVMGDRFQVKRVFVYPGAALSLQSHHHRSEHWIIVQGTAKITVGDTVELVSENQSIYVPLGTKHRLENPGKLPVVLIEVQTGAYLGEDDIIRHEDIYDRSQLDERKAR